MCSAAADLLGVGGVGIVVMAEGMPGATFTSNRLAAALEDLQSTLGTAQEWTPAPKASRFSRATGKCPSNGGSASAGRRSRLAPAEHPPRVRVDGRG